MSSDSKPIIIIGAGISGLTLAQGLRKANAPFEIFERRPTKFFGSSGWGLTIHWALPDFKGSLPHDIIDRMPETYVNRDAVDRGERGNFTFYDLSKAEARWRVPAADRIRVNRDKVRELLMTGVDVQYSKKLVSFDTSEDSIVAHFEDGTSTTGSILVGCDGVHSRVRQLSRPNCPENYRLPIRIIGVTAIFPADLARQAFAIDPFFFQGSDPRTDAYLWFSFLDTSYNNESSASSTCQVMVSWPYRPDFLGEGNPPLEVPSTSADRIALMKQLSSSWADPFRSLVQSIPADAESTVINLQDWVPHRNMSRDSRVTLAGDAGHTMVMYRGEGANHALKDVSSLLHHLHPHLSPYSPSSPTVPSAIGAYESEMFGRSRLAVLASRQACLDAHEYARISEESPLISKRAVVPDYQA